MELQEQVCRIKYFVLIFQWRISFVLHCRLVRYINIKLNVLFCIVLILNTFSISPLGTVSFTPFNSDYVISF